MRKRYNILFIVLLLFLFLGIGYAYLTTNLNINGTSVVNRASWDVYFNNIQVSSGSVSPNSAATIGSNNLTVSYSVTLDKPGDFYEFTVDVVNGGTIDAMIESVSSRMNGVIITSLPSYLDYSITYVDGAPVSQYQLLAANTTDTYKVRVGYKLDILPEDLPQNPQSIEFSFGVTYVQSDNNAQSRVVYGINYLGKSINTVAVGDRISIANENFAVNEITDNAILAIPYYNIELTEDHPVQSATAGTTTFANTRYWGQEPSIDMYYKPDGINYANNVQKYVDAYKITLQDYAVTNFDVKVTNYTQTSYLNVTHTGCYWTSTCHPPDYDHGIIYSVNSSGNHVTTSYRSSCGVRPILFIYK